MATFTLEDGYELPEFYGFPPLYTIQPCISTREKQFKMWSEIILAYHKSVGESQMVPDTFSLFTNEKLDRSLSSEGRKQLIEFMIEHGNAEWANEDKSRVLLIFKSVEALAAEIYIWTQKQEMRDMILTVYELHSGEDYQDSGFHGTDPELFMRALQRLHEEGKCTIFEGEVSSERGVKFQ
jgi:ESCRT-II complex subunit VPS25